MLSQLVLMRLLSYSQISATVEMKKRIEQNLLLSWLLLELKLLFLLWLDSLVRSKMDVQIVMLAVITLLENNVMQTLKNNILEEDHSNFLGISIMLITQHSCIKIKIFFLKILIKFLKLLLLAGVHLFGSGWLNTILVVGVCLKLLGQVSTIVKINVSWDLLNVLKQSVPQLIGFQEIKHLVMELCKDQVVLEQLFQLSMEDMIVAQVLLMDILMDILLIESGGSKISTIFGLMSLLLI